MGIPSETLVLMRKFADITVHKLHHNTQSVEELGVALIPSVAGRLILLDAELHAGSTG